MRLPTVETIEATLPTARWRAQRIRKKLELYRDKLACNATIVLSDVNDIIGGHGVEYLRSNQDTSREAWGVEYVNMGDPYRPTVLFDHSSQSFSVGCWGDVVERNPGRFGV